MYEAFLKTLKEEFPDVTFQEKAESKFMLFLSKLLLIISFGQMKTFLTEYTTTIGSTIYTPTTWMEKPEWVRLVILRHERVHLLQQKRYPRFVFPLLYLFVAPLFFAYFRAKFEKEAYEETLRAVYEHGGMDMVLRQKEWMLSQFTGPAYGWMWCSRSSMEKWFDSVVSKLGG